MNNWQVAKQRIGRNQVDALADQLEILATDALRVSADHPPETIYRGRPQDLSFINFMKDIRQIASIAGAVMELPSNEYDPVYSTPLRDFGEAALQLAIKHGKGGIESLRLPEGVYRESHDTLDRYLKMVHLLTEYLRPEEKRKRRKRKAISAGTVSAGEKS